MKSLVSGLGLALLGSVQLLGCATTTPTDCQPGDADCAAPIGSGKADGWDSVNDPEVMAQHLDYHLANLPKKGWRNTPVWKDEYPSAVGTAATVWADTYWPASEGSHNNRWQGPTIKSPLEKYDQAFNSAPGCDTYPADMYGSNAKAEWDTYDQCAGPAAKWQTDNYETIGYMHDGIDNDNDGVTDDYGSNGSIDGVEGWWGSCHAWTPASELVPEPQHAVTMNGVRFEVGDIKALIQNVFDQTSAVMLGGRCNDQTITHDANGSANSACADVNPGALHVVLTNFLGLNQLPLIEDKTANYQVWNQPIVGYEITQQDKVDAKTANACVGATGDTWTYNTNAAVLYEVRMTISYVVEGSPGTAPIGYKDNTSTDDYHYILEVDDAGKVIGGRYCTESADTHPDFLWSPTGSFDPSNPNVDVANVEQLVRAAVGPDTGDSGSGSGSGSN